MNIEQLNEYMRVNDAATAISELQKGRMMSSPDMNTIGKQIDPTTHDVMNKAIRKDKIVTVLADDTLTADEEEMFQYDRTDGTRKKIEPVTRVALALQKLIVKRAVAFLFGNPVTLKSDIEKDSEEDAVYQAVQKVLMKVKSRTMNRKIAREIFTYTECAEFWYLSEGEKADRYGFESTFKLRTAIWSPVNGNQLFPYFDEYGDMIAFSRKFELKDVEGVAHTFFETYTDTEHLMWELAEGIWQLCEGYPQKNAIGKIPVVYGCQPATEWADVQIMIDRLEKLLSNFGDCNDYHGSPKIFVTGQIDGFASKGEQGTVIQGQEGATAQYLSWQQAPEAIRLEIDTLLRMIYTITQTPDISFDAMKSIGQVSGTALKLLFMDAHLKVMEKSEIFDEYLVRRISIIKSYLKMMNTSNVAFRNACDSCDIEPEIKPYMIEDLQSMVNTVMAATGQKSVMSRRTGVVLLGQTPDPDAEIKQIEAEESMSMVGDIFNPEG